MMICGLGMDADFAGAYTLLEDAIKDFDDNETNKKGFGLIYYQLGDLTLDGNGCTKDESKAKTLFEIAINKYGNHEAYLALGDIYQYGLGETKDEKVAKDYYEKGIDSIKFDSIPKDKISEYGDILNLLGIFYFYNSNSVTRKENFIKARKYFELASKFENEEATSTLNYFDDNEFGIESSE
jgi:TPR repeat protein